VIGFPSAAMKNNRRPSDLLARRLSHPGGRADWSNVRHCVTNTMTDVHGDTATSSPYLQVLLTGREGTRFMCVGRYHDTFVRVAGEWRFKERKVVRGEVPA
jgi:hypothetical protein